MNGIFWIASYPKSGNTWFRVFLTNLKRDDCAPANINELEGTPIASDREIFSIHTGIEASNLTEREIDELRPGVFEHLSQESSGIFYCKIHDAYSQTMGGGPLIPQKATVGAIYIVRNPLDVAISYAHHSGVAIDRAIAVMADESHTLGASRGRLGRQLPQRLLSWSKHVLSWVAAPGLDIHVMRYEDMHRDPLTSFSEAARFARLPCDPTMVEKALQFSAFDLLQQMERAHGFREKSRHAESFFRNGKVGSWRSVLSDAQVSTICEQHGPVMRRLGYLNDYGVVDTPLPFYQISRHVEGEASKHGPERWTADNDTVVVRSNEVIFTDTEGEIGVVSLRDGTYCGLDTIGSRIWALIERPITISSLCATLMREFEVSAVQCKRDVIQFLGRLFEGDFARTVCGVEGNDGAPSLHK